MANRAVRWCPGPGSQHPATHRTGFCDLHHTERARALQNYRAAKHAHGVKGVGNDPGSRDEYLAQIIYTPAHEAWTVLGPADRARIRAQVLVDYAAINYFVGLVEDPGAFYAVHETELKRRIRTLVEEHAASVRLLTELGEDPS